MKNKLSIVIPVYYNAESLLPTYESIVTEVVPNVDDYEIIFVDDGSKDNSWEVMNKIADMDNKVRLLRFPRNFGAPVATYAGFSAATGDCIVIKAADLQEPAELIVKMYHKWKEGNKYIIAAREGRQESPIKVFLANSYYRIIKRVAFKNMPAKGYDIYMIDASIMKVLKRMNEKNSTLRLQLLWMGYEPCIVPYVRRNRQIGKSKWTLAKKIKLAKDSLIGFSEFPVQVIENLSMCMFVVCFILLIIQCCLQLFGYPVHNLFFISNIIFFCTSLLLLGISIIGEYILRIIDESRNRPVYIISDSRNIQEEN